MLAWSIAGDRNWWFRQWKMKGPPPFLDYLSDYFHYYYYYIISRQREREMETAAIRVI